MSNFLLAKIHKYLLSGFFFTDFDVLTNSFSLFLPTHIKERNSSATNRMEAIQRISEVVIVK